MDLVPYAVPFFLLAIGIEYAWGRARGNDTYRLSDSINSLSCGILSTTIKLVVLDIGGRVFTQADGLPSNAITSVAGGPGTSVWVGTNGAGAFRFDNGRVVERLKI